MPPATEMKLQTICLIAAQLFINAQISPAEAASQAIKLYDAIEAQLARNV